MSFLLHNLGRDEINPLDVQNDQMLTHQTVAGILQRLEGKGFIRCTQSQKDKRYKRITVTQKGIELEAFLKGAAADSEARLVRGMSEKDRKEFSRLLRIVQLNLAE
jgi:DNA-binding MarR family transcriptional regulator